MSTRQITISTDAYAAIWADRKTGEEDEDAIIRRKFGVIVAPAPNRIGSLTKIGFADARFGIELPEGFEVFRVYRGKEYRAKAHNGQWRLDGDGKEYPSFNQLSGAIGTKTENAWRNWYFKASDGKRQLIDRLRRK